MIRKLLLAVMTLSCVSTVASAQSTYPTPAGSRVQGFVSLSCDTNQANCAPVAGGVNAPSANATAGVTPVTTTVASGSLVAKASAGNLYGYNVTTGASAGYILAFNSTTVPADGAVTPSLCVPVAANTGVDQSYRTPEYFTAGIVFVFSTTGCFTKTVSATAFISVNAK